MRIKALEAFVEKAALASDRFKTVSNNVISLSKKLHKLTLLVTDLATQVENHAVILQRVYEMNAAIVDAVKSKTSEETKRSSAYDLDVKRAEKPSKPN